MLQIENLLNTIMYVTIFCAPFLLGKLVRDDFDLYFFWALSRS
jgi:hypothetical protein